MQDVAALAFLGEIMDEDIFISSANRALGLIYSERAVTKEAVISNEAPRVLFYLPNYRHTGGEFTSYSLLGKAYSFKSSGNGYYKITDGYKTETHELYGNMKEHRGFLSSGGEITFFGDFAFSIYHLASFADRKSGDARDVDIYDGRECLDAKAKISDFHSFTSLPKNEAGEEIPGASVREGIVYLPRGFFGEIYLTYRCTPPTLSLFSKEEEIDIPKDTEELLPLLTASFMLLDDEPDKAEYYMSLYREMLGAVLRYHTRELSSEYITNGWA